MDDSPQYLQMLGGQVSDTPRTLTLVENLKDHGSCSGMYPTDYDAGMCNEAADRIEQLERELSAALAKLEAARPSEDAIKGANNIIEALGDSGRDRAHDEFADDVASELLRIHEATRT